jgi:hypothetical protein
MAYKSDRTKKLEEAKTDDDMPGVKKAVKKTAVGISRAIDKVEGYFKKDKPKEMAKGGAVKKAFKPCANCPTPAKCKAAGKCLAKKAAGGMLVIPVKMEKSTPTKYAGASTASKADKKKPAAKKKAK